MTRFRNITESRKHGFLKTKRSQKKCMARISKSDTNILNLVNK